MNGGEKRENKNGPRLSFPTAFRKHKYFTKTIRIIIIFSFSTKIVTRKQIQTNVV